ncbi:MAG: 2Fe-2S iron-sulfur cluster-binding protein [Pseudopelagicola sp.]|nr:2Fe-2S iron-sulfur cluster-binding protein [Pseudopelagicola sp.]
MTQITFISPDGVETLVEAKDGLSVMEAARAANIDGIVAECGGSCSCSTCHVYVDADWAATLDAPEDMETDLLDFAWEPDPARSRLSCQITVSEALEGLRVTVPAQQG